MDIPEYVTYIGYTDNPRHIDFIKFAEEYLISFKRYKTFNEESDNFYAIVLNPYGCYLWFPKEWFCTNHKESSKNKYNLK
jgi:hypothetical protein